ncbi:MAG: hypothetical protein ACRDT0_13865 [Pseudonocardiaceae bacterium]
MSTHRRAPVSDFAGGASEVLAGAVLERLQQLDLIAAGEPRSEAEVAQIRAGMRRAIDMWRSLLERHRADDAGRCPHCRIWCGRRRRWPCRVWIAAHTCLIGHDPSQYPVAARRSAVTAPPPRLRTLPDIRARGAGPIATSEETDHDSR